MPTRAYYLEQAELLMKLAKASTDPVASTLLTERAAEYQILADAMPPDDPAPAPPPESVAQPMQQQQQRATKSENDDTEPAK
jgi:hypothetical protein